MHLTYPVLTLPRRSFLRLPRRPDDPHRISSRTPEGHYGRCPVCGEFICVEFSPMAGDAPCPSCGQLLWKQELRWPFHPDEPGLPLRGRRPARRPGLPLRLGRALGRLARAVLSRPRPAATVLPNPPSSSAMYDAWLDG